jgi:thiol-disulfide isomerase/thioredoxin
VILLDFWTYSCVNCQNTQPYLNAWQDRYADDGLQIIGIHKPEFEKDPAGVEAAVRQAGIEYPVVLDNNDGTWNAYDQSYWPTTYLIDSDGFVRYKHIGEGAYKDTEAEIQKLLAERDRAGS